MTGKGRILVSGSRDKSIIVWRIEEEQEFKPILVKQVGSMSLVGLLRFAWLINLLFGLVVWFMMNE